MVGVEASDTAGATTLWSEYVTKADAPPRILLTVPQSSLRTRTAPPTAVLPLDAFVRHLCQGQCSPFQKSECGNNTTTILTEVLVDALGCLRALQFDLDEYNACGGPTLLSTQQQQPENSNDSINERTYRSHRLQRQAAAIGIRLLVTEPSISMPGLDSLVTYLETKSGKKHAQMQLDQGMVDFDSLAEYYRPGLDYMDRGLLTGSVGAALCVRCRSCFYRRGKSALGNIVRTFHASFEFVVATGRFAIVEARYLQSEFVGSRRTNGSSAEIMERADDNSALWQALLERGRLYQKVVCTNPAASSDGGTGHLVCYAADSFWTVGKGQSGRPLRTGGRLMVDTTEAWARGAHASKAPADGMADEAVASAYQAYTRWKRAKEQASRDGATPASLEGEVLLLTGTLPDVLLRRTWPVVCGFSLDNRSWGIVRVDGLTPVVFQERALDDLVLPSNRKRLVQALVSTHGTSQRADAMPGKGEGLIFLLHGPPGCGKTLTAEAVAEVLHRPLYRVSMGELGTEPGTLEEKLKEIFDLCFPWRAIVLLDEAEFLLETRGSDLVRNALVCVMLRLLEYYPGILFLTTNRGLSALDPAMASRVTVALRYNDLDLAGRRAVWVSRLASVSTVALDDDTIDELAQYAINGRQIKNAVQLAAALASYEDVELNIDHLRETLELLAVEAC